MGDWAHQSFIHRSFFRFITTTKDFLKFWYPYFGAVVVLGAPLNTSGTQERGEILSGRKDAAKGKQFRLACCEATSIEDDATGRGCHKCYRLV
ncbi:MAG: hypothetical protein Ta2B_20160 [Termitinemataceae bacterium]|nr:MAG: hypothetical protein Ta2B_20160 [Termitinemataceae bacterium]